MAPHPDITLTTEVVVPTDEAAYIFEFFIDGNRAIQARRNDFQAVLRTELAVSYQDPDLRVGGYVEFQKGTFEVFGKTFELTRGSMPFNGSSELNPDLNAVARYEFEGGGIAPVLVNVSGTLTNPRVEFHSDSCPGYGAVALLISGQCPSDDATMENRGAQDAFAAGIVSGILTLGAQRELGGLLPRISVETAGEGQDSATRFAAGIEAVPKFMRSVVQRVYLQGAVSTRSDSPDAQASNGGTTLDFLIELYFPHNIIGRGVFSQNNSWGLDVLWEP